MNYGRVFPGMVSWSFVHNLSEKGFANSKVIFSQISDRGCRAREKIV
jgi:hypothetical protein